MFMMIKSDDCEFLKERNKVAACNEIYFFYLKFTFFFKCFLLYDASRFNRFLNFIRRRYERMIKNIIITEKFKNCAF